MRPVETASMLSSTPAQDVSLEFPQKKACQEWCMFQALEPTPVAESEYASSKGSGEAEVNGTFPGAVILRPSVIFGPEDQFFNRFAAMARLSPILPLVGAETKFSLYMSTTWPLPWEKGVLGEADAGTYELGGPDVNSFRELMEGMLKVIRRRSLDRALALLGRPCHRPDQRSRLVPHVGCSEAAHHARPGN